MDLYKKYDSLPNMQQSSVEYRLVTAESGVQKRRLKVKRNYLPCLGLSRAVFVRFSLGGQSFDWRLATIAGMEVAKLVPWNSWLN